MLGMRVLRVAGAAAHREAIAVCLSREERAIEAILKNSCGVVAALNWWLLRGRLFGGRVDDV